MPHEPAVRLFVDASSQMPFAGSCSVVSYLLRQSFEASGVDCEETLVQPPRIGRDGVLVPAERVSVAPAGAHDLFFEEVFLRADFDPPAHRERASVYFNLLCFGDDNLSRYAGARALLFNSTFLMRVFLAYVSDPAYPERRGQFASTHFADCPPCVPAACFPEGYPSRGEDPSEAALDRLKRHHVLAHALRPGLDPVAAVAIAQGLRKLLPASRPPRIVVLASQWQALRHAAESLGIPEPEALFEGVPRLSNRSMVRLMKESDFGLAYDQSIEAFGLYAVESIWHGTPVYTNGAGNLRHLLPRDHGIEWRESTAMAFGAPREVLAAYAQVARQIVDDLRSGGAKKRCVRGRVELLRRYSAEGFAEKVHTALYSGAPNPPSAEGGGRYCLHPLVRHCDLSSGRIITDEAAIELGEGARTCLQDVLQSRSPDDEGALSSLLRERVLTPRLAPPRGG